MRFLIFSIVILLAIYLKYQFDLRFRPRRTAELREGRRCAWCGKPITEETEAIGYNGEGGTIGPLIASRAHLACEEEAFRRHKRYYYFFVGMAVFGVVMTIVGLLCDMARGFKVGWKEIELLASMSIPIFLLPLMIRGHILPWSKKVEDASRRQRESE